MNVDFDARNSWLMLGMIWPGRRLLVPLHSVDVH